MNTPDASEDWAGARAERWVRSQAQMEGQLAPITDLLLTAARLSPGERVLDVGCGTGPTTRQAAQAVGPAGAVVGVDIAALMLQAAGRAAPDPGAATIEWVEADAASWHPGVPPFDVVLSRFGTMFFADPVGAFANLLALTAPGGRLHLAVWAHRPHSELFELPYSVTMDVLAGAGVAPEAPSIDGGPFSLGDDALVHRILGAAGWVDVTAEARAVRLPLGGGLVPADAARVSLEFGAAGAVTRDVDAGLRSRIVEAVARCYEDHVDEHGVVMLEATPVLVAAHRPS